MHVLAYLTALSALCIPLTLPSPLADSNCLGKPDGVECRDPTPLGYAYATWQRDHKPGEIFRGVGADKITPGIAKIYNALLGKKANGAGGKGNMDYKGATSPNAAKAPLDEGRRAGITVKPKPSRALAALGPTQVQTAKDGQVTAVEITV